MAATFTGVSPTHTALYILSGLPHYHKYKNPLLTCRLPNTPLLSFSTKENAHRCNIAMTHPTPSKIPMQANPTRTNSSQECLKNTRQLTPKTPSFQSPEKRPLKEQRPLVRLCMVLSSFTPLYILIAIRGLEPFPGINVWGVCGTLAILPNIGLLMAIHRAKKLGKHPKTIGNSVDHKVHALSYLLAILLPLYQQAITSLQEFTAMVLALAIVLFLFFNLHLHYINIFFAIAGFRIFTVYPPPCDTNPLSGNDMYVLITKRTHLPQCSTVFAFRLSNTVFIEC